jgi:choline-glycine betaine transporter
MKGIRLLSALNTVIFIGLMVFVLVTGPTRFILAFGIESFGHFLKGFFRASQLCVTTVPDTWTKDWTIFYWAWWFAWTPMVAVFIGRISYGYTVRQFLVFNLLLPALFGAVWMAVFGGAAIHMELYQNAGLVQALEKNGTEGVMYALLSHLPLTQFMVPLFLFTVFLSFVTAADSNTSAMSGLSSTGISPENPEPSVAVKVIWGVMAGAIAWIMVSSAGLDGLRMISNLGGLPAMLLCLMIAVTLIKVVLSPAKYDRFKDRAPLQAGQQNERNRTSHRQLRT